MTEKVSVVKDWGLRFVLLLGKGLIAIYKSLDGKALNLFKAMATLGLLLKFLGRVIV